jgi:hypothetical protein
VAAHVRSVDLLGLDEALTRLAKSA